MNNSIKIKSLNPLILPLRGECLIEASAGTGKTFTISLIYLRLLLGLHKENAYLRPLSVEEILVVTFTDVAKIALRKCIYQNIHNLRLACVRKKSNNPILIELLDDIQNHHDAASLLLLAERQIDNAAIFTIHSFCQRMLNIHTFESGIFFQHHLIEDDEKLLFKQATIDFWRRYCYPLNIEIVKIIANIWKGPEQLLSTIYPWIKGEIPNLLSSNSNETIISRHKKNLAIIVEIKLFWLSMSTDEIFQLIYQSNIDKRSYNIKSLYFWIDKISQWAKHPTQDYCIPSELKYFDQKVLTLKTKKGIAPCHILFSSISHFLEKKITLHDLIIVRAIKHIQYFTKKEKKLKGLLSFHDLLSRMYESLKKSHNNQLAKDIRERFPVALIDEFQDTDPLQYRIFHFLYMNQSFNSIFLIGDPKQAIYAFRGADIFTYIQARKEIKKQYTMNTNWRSSFSMVKAVNHIFSRINDPFLFKDIPFFCMTPAKINENLTFNINGQPQAAIRFWLKPGMICNINDYQQYMAKKCAANINYWLHAAERGKASIGTHLAPKIIQSSDIIVLVRSREEANLIRDALNEFGIQSVYLSHRDSVYSTIEAKELLWVMKAILQPERENLLRTALTTTLFSFNAKQLDTLYDNENESDNLLNNFSIWNKMWKEKGILAMFRNLIIVRQLAEKLLICPKSKHYLTNILHLAELLQHAAVNLDTHQSLIRYLENKITNPNRQDASEQIRLENDKNIINITTIYKAKGLQYSLVWLPFAAKFQKTKIAFYHDRKSLKATVDLKCHQDNLILAEEERLAEDLRLLYVALTRSIYHCSIGIAPISCTLGKKISSTDLHHAALGYLLQRGQNSTAQQLLKILQELSKNYNEFDYRIDSEKNSKNNHLINFEKNILLNSRKTTRKFTDCWRVTSYSELQKNNEFNLHNYVIDNFDTNYRDFDKNIFNPSSTQEQPIILTPYDFPTGTESGIFLHTLFESMDFMNIPNLQKLEEYLHNKRYPLYWAPILIEWIKKIVVTPLNDEGIKLFKISKENKLVEMSFSFPINSILTAKKLNQIIQKNDILSSHAPPLTFDELEGILRGFIDLIFRWKGKYYLLDYKSNLLGNNQDAYEKEKIIKIMIKHRYDVQYQIYTLALHRYLKLRINNYDYDEHFGGIFYLFIRGINGYSCKHGIFYKKLNKNFLSQLNNLFL